MNQIFKVGEKVISLSNNVTPGCQPRVKGKLYPVQDILYCCGCGRQWINVSGPHKNKLDSYVSCSSCKKLQLNHGLWWTDSIGFVRPEEISEAITHFAEKEEFEICGVLKKFEQENLVPVEKTETKK